MLILILCNEFVGMNQRESRGPLNYHPSCGDFPDHEDTSWRHSY